MIYEQGWGENFLARNIVRIVQKNIDFLGVVFYDSNK